LKKVKAGRRKPRSDAIENRERLIEAAKEVLGLGGPDASLEAVARRAEVGIGTLYRHFPTREALFQAVYRHEVEQLIRLAGDLQGAGDAVEALRAWMHAYVGLVATKRGLLGALAVVVSEESKAMYAELSLRVKASVETLLARAVLAGELRPDIRADDLLQTMFALCYARQPEAGWTAQVLRLLDIFIDGLRTRETGRGR
jgi:AcrR family transcriptional regulator